MFKLLLLIICAILISCSSHESKTFHDIKSPGYQYSRPMDEKALESSFLEKNS
jgi:hypothetical protein